MNKIFEINNFDVTKIIHDLGACQHNSVLASLRALNKTALWLRTQSVKQISSNRKLPQKLIRDRLRVLKASRNDLKALVIANVSGIKTTKVGVPKQTARGAKVRNYEFPGAFVATMPGGSTGIFKRKGKTRLPIRELYISLEPESSKIIESFLDNRIRQRFEEIFRHELKHLMQK